MNRNRSNDSNQQKSYYPSVLSYHIRKCIHIIFRNLLTTRIDICASFSIISFPIALHLRHFERTGTQHRLPALQKSTTRLKLWAIFSYSSYFPHFQYIKLPAIESLYSALHIDVNYRDSVLRINSETFPI